ncbi:LuxR family transcriptional regulator, partial [Actinomadura bangladeshensis]|nr:LuxR family transcriptional regulator [Actinomadura bangladeshensis]
ALVTLGVYRESREADSGVAELFARARDLADAAGDSSQAALRARFQYARTKFDRGDLAGAAAATDEGVRFALDNGVEWSMFGTAIRTLRYLVRYTTGDWAEADRLAAGFPLQVVRPAEAQVSAYALFVEVARGLPVVEERLRWLAPLWHEDQLANYIARGLAAEHALWRDEPEAVLEHVDSIAKTLYGDGATFIRIAATGLWAHAELAARARAAGDADAVRRAAEA